MLYDMAWYGVVWCGVAWNDEMRCCFVWCGAMQCDAMWSDVVWCSVAVCVLIKSYNVDEEWGEDKGTLSSFLCFIPFLSIQHYSIPYLLS